MKAERLIEIIEATNYDALAYGGRGMCGEECVAVTVDDGILRWLSSAIKECDGVTEAAWLVGRAKTDDMGRGEIIYWPAVGWPEDREE